MVVTLHMQYESSICATARALLVVQVLQGSEPNEHGTWQYGRGGWCDGQEVIFEKLSGSPMAPLLHLLMLQHQPCCGDMLKEQQTSDTVHPMQCASVAGPLPDTVHHVICDGAYCQCVQTNVCMDQVRPWVVDITDDLMVGHHKHNSVSYHGLYQGHSPQPEGQPGFIMMQSNVVFYA